MDPLLKLLASDASLSAPQLAAMLHLTESEVRAKIKQAEQDRLVLGYRAVLNEEKLGRDLVRAMIEVKITPERRDAVITGRPAVEPSRSSVGPATAGLVPESVPSGG